MRKLQFIIVALLITAFAVSCCPKKCDAQVIIENGHFQIATLIDKDTISNPTIGIMVVHTDSLLYYYTGDEWIVWTLTVNNNTQCCPNIVHYSFLGEPTQELFETVFGHSTNDYMGTLYSPLSEKAWYFTYIHNAVSSKWKWIALKD